MCHSLHPQRMAVAALAVCSGASFPAGPYIVPMTCHTHYGLFFYFTTGSLELRVMPSCRMQGRWQAAVKQHLPHWKAWCQCYGQLLSNKF